VKIALVCSHYFPNRTSCAVQMRDLAVEFLRQGHEPVVIVPSDDITKGWNVSQLDGIDVYQLASFKVTNVNFVRRGIGELLMPFTMLFTLMCAKFPSSKVDLVVWYSPSIFFGPLVWFLKLRSSCKGYLILRDIFPEWLVDLGIMKKGVIYYFFRAVARFQYSVADCIGVQSHSNLAYFEKWLDSNQKTVYVLDNWLSEQRQNFEGYPLVENIFPGRKIFVYIGNMGIAQDMDILIDLADELRDRADVGFLFVGRGTEKERLGKLSQEKSLNNIFFHDEIDSEAIPGLLEQCAVGLIALDPKHKSHNIPGKFLSYIKAGVPVLARINPNTDLEHLIRGEILGEVYTGDDAKPFSICAMKLLDNESSLKEMSTNGKAYFRANYSVSAAATNIIKSLPDKSSMG
jgi:glycosyltransferase involved in cell wall biosynthesis